MANALHLRRRISGDPDGPKRRLTRIDHVVREEQFARQSESDPAGGSRDSRTTASVRPPILIPIPESPPPTSAPRGVDRQTMPARGVRRTVTHGGTPIFGSFSPTPSASRTDKRHTTGAIVIVWPLHGQAKAGAFRDGADEGKDSDDPLLNDLGMSPERFSCRHDRKRSADGAPVRGLRQSLVHS